MDLKLGDSGISDLKKSGEKMATMMTQSGSLFPPGESIPLHVLLGAEDIEQKEFFVGFRKYLKINRLELLDQFGYDFTGTDTDINEILRTFKEIGIRRNIWVGDGTINCWLRGTHRSNRSLWWAICFKIEEWYLAICSNRTFIHSTCTFVHSSHTFIHLSCTFLHSSHTFIR